MKKALLLIVAGMFLVVGTSVALAEKAPQKVIELANAEESASASEEMNTQAGQMKTFVNNLVALVAGRRSNDSMDGAHLRTERAAYGAGRSHKTATPVRSALNKRPGKIARTDPEQIIPLEDDFKDF